MAVNNASATLFALRTDGWSREPQSGHASPLWRLTAYSSSLFCTRKCSVSWSISEICFFSCSIWTFRNWIPPKTSDLDVKPLKTASLKRSLIVSSMVLISFWNFWTSSFLSTRCWLRFLFSTCHVFTSESIAWSGSFAFSVFKNISIVSFSNLRFSANLMVCSKVTFPLLIRSFWANISADKTFTRAIFVSSSACFLSNSRLSKAVFSSEKAISDEAISSSAFFKLDASLSICPVFCMIFWPFKANASIRLLNWIIHCS